MTILVDTHPWLWALSSPERLSGRAREILEDPRNRIYLSAASSWEIAIKFALGKLELPEPPSRYVPSRLAAMGMTPLPIEHAHALHAGSLPLHHRDPFDRLLVAQAILEKLTLLTADPELKPYRVRTIWAR